MKKDPFRIEKDNSEQSLTWHENERRRIAAEMHDHIGQSLTEIKLRLEQVLSGFGDNLPPPEHSRKISQLHAITTKVRDTIDDVRRIAMNLRPSILDDLGVIAAIHWFCDEFHLSHKGIQLLKRIEAEEKHIAEALKIVIFRIIQEALNNVHKHAGARTVRVSLTHSDDRIQLLIQDDGDGFDPKQNTLGFGLSNMRQRARLSGGKFQILSEPGLGTTIEAIWPFSSRDSV
jgi:signal transduction histidine kinase